MSRPVILLDFDDTLFDTARLKRDALEARLSPEEFVASNELISYVFPESLECLEILSKVFKCKVFTEGEVTYQRTKLTRSGINRFIPEADWLIFPPHEKTRALPNLRTQYPFLIVVDNSPQILNAALSHGCITVACLDDPSLLEMPVSLWTPRLTARTGTQLQVLADLSVMNHVYMVGITGVGMAALAQMMLDASISVRGSDSNSSQITSAPLAARGIEVESFETQVPESDLVVFSGAYHRGEHPQLPLAPTTLTLSLAHALSAWITNTKVVAICGVGGKTTTSALLAHLCQDKANWYVGTGNIGPLPSGKWQRGEWTIVEADEYAISPSESTAPKFSLLSPSIVICTNLLFDHPDIYSNLEDSKKVYRALFERVGDDGLIIGNANDLAFIESSSDLSTPVIAIGDQPSSDVHYVYHPESGTVALSGEVSTEINTNLSGEMNARNVAYAYLAATKLGIPHNEAVEKLSSFPGTSRRQQLMGEHNQITYLDDYAHHPHEIKALLKALKQKYGGRRLLVVFHAHTASRTKALLGEFAQSLSLADMVILPPIFTSAREKDADPTLLPSLRDACTNQVVLVSSLKEAATWVQSNQLQGDVVVTVGAGDVYNLHSHWIKS